MAVSVVPVGNNKKLAAAWVDFPYRLYRNEGNWIPPLRSDAMRALDRKRNPLYRYADIEHFVLLDDDIAVGRIAASVHPDYNEKFGSRTGFFGFFECLPMPNYAGRLLEAAEQWATDRGMTSMAGPYNYFSGQDMGLLIDGFDRPAAAFQTYNQHYYRGVLENHGYATDFTATAYEIDRDAAISALRELRGPGDELRRQYGLVVRPLRKSHFTAEMDIVRRLFNTSFVDNHAVIPYRRDLFFDLVRPLRWVAPGDYVRIIERHGAPIGFVALAPNVGDLLRPLHGNIRPLDVFRLPRLLHNMDGLVATLGGVKPGSPKGMSQIITAELFDVLVKSGRQTLHTTWVHDDNVGMFRLLERWGMKPVKRYAILEKELVRS